MFWRTASLHIQFLYVPMLSVSWLLSPSSKTEGRSLSSLSPVGQVAHVEGPCDGLEPSWMMWDTLCWIHLVLNSICNINSPAAGNTIAWNTKYRFYRLGHGYRSFIILPIADGKPWVQKMMLTEFRLLSHIRLYRTWCKRVIFCLFKGTRGLEKVTSREGASVSNLF